MQLLCFSLFSELQQLSVEVLFHALIDFQCSQVWDYLLLCCSFTFLANWHLAQVLVVDSFLLVAMLPWFSVHSEPLISFVLVAARVFVLFPPFIFSPAPQNSKFGQVCYLRWVTAQHGVWPKKSHLMEISTHVSQQISVQVIARRINQPSRHHSGCPGESHLSNKQQVKLVCIYAHIDHPTNNLWFVSLCVPHSPFQTCSKICSGGWPMLNKYLAVLLSTLLYFEMQIYCHPELL